MPERLSLSVVWFEDPGESMAILDAQRKQILVLPSTQMVAISHQFSHRFESEDHVGSWFCLTPR